MDLMSANNKGVSQGQFSGKKMYLFWGIIALIFIVALASYSYIGFFTRYWYDDFCTAGTLKNEGFINSQIFWYTTWSGRFSFHITINLLELVGPRIVTVLPFLAIFIWCISTTWAIYQWFLAVKLPCAMPVSFVLALAVVFLTLDSTPDLVQSLYWQTGMLTYLAPIILLTIWGGGLIFISRKPPKKILFRLLLLAGFALCFVAGGLSETYGILQLGILIILLAANLIGFRYGAKRISTAFIIAGLCGAVLAFSIVFFAPGNKGREAVLPEPPSKIAVVQSSFLYTLNFAERHSRRSRGVALLSLVLPAWLALMLGEKENDSRENNAFSEMKIKSALKIIGLLTITGFFLMFICFVPAFYALSESPPLRAQILPKFILVTFMMCAGFVFMQAVINIYNRKSKIKFWTGTGTSIALILLMFVPLISAGKTFALREKARIYAEKWDENERAMAGAKHSGINEIIIPYINANEFELGFGRPEMLPTDNPDEDRNMCLERYFNLNSVIAK